MVFGTRIPLLALLVAFALPPGSAAGQERTEGDEAGRRLSASLEDVEREIDSLIESASARGAILTGVTKIVQSLDVPGPDQKLLAESLAGMRDLERLAGESETSRELRLSLGLATDRLRTELLNPWSTDTRKLAEDLHHSVGYAARGENRRDVRLMSEFLSAMLQTDSSLDRFVAQLKVSTAERARISIPLIRSAERPDALFHAFDEYQRNVMLLAARLRTHREIAGLIAGSMKDLETFQNAIGLQKAQEKLEEARDKFTPGLDEQLRVAVDLGLERVNVALLSPSSTNMEMLRDELHHAMGHRAESVLLDDALEGHAQVKVMFGLRARAIDAAARLEDALAAAFAREIPAMRFKTGPGPAGLR